MVGTVVHANKYQIPQRTIYRRMSENYTMTWNKIKAKGKNIKAHYQEENDWATAYYNN